MLAEMQQLLKEQSMCVLATSAGDRPYCSLMAYGANADGTEVYMATPRSTRKFRNLTVNPTVSLMIDTRQEAPRPLVRALTFEGTCVPVTDDVRNERIRSHLLAAHPHLKDFLAHEDCAILCVTITSFLLLKGLSEAYYATLE
jgi:nitroimidazol reductase NimA-like FMN-containing flavoprotein (pyridoxamine 5'-phosphate oxidase superfamily)